MEFMALPGLERLMEVCQRLSLRLETLPPAREPVKAGCLLEGLPFDPVLASVYARLGRARFATELVAAGWGLEHSDDQVHELKEENKRWRERWWEELGEPMIVFGGDLYIYATVPRLADDRGRQPVVRVDTYEEPYVLPVASNVDRFFDSYSRYVEALVASPEYRTERESSFLFPWHVTDILARDERLVELMRSRRFDELMKNMKTVEDVRHWFEKVCGAPL
ncbi:hypothetical protein [Archangium sp.]|uniref:hypothetical protein n=1 Tax=Archangium sp. TaxID=1872627 RepID=UPI00286B23DB|nr:hypothetical protein [Archangium sp.]